MHFAAHVYSLNHECNYCTLLLNPTSLKPVTVFINLVILAHLQVDPQHSCGLFKETTVHGATRMYHNELPSHKLTMGFSRATISMSHCACCSICAFELINNHQKVRYSTFYVGIGQVNNGPRT